MTVCRALKARPMHGSWRSCTWRSSRPPAALPRIGNWWPTIRRLVEDWRNRGGVVSTIDVSQLLHEEHERRTYHWLYGEDPKVISPLPEFYQAVRDSFGEIAHEGGGEMLSLGQDTALVRHVLVLTFGPRWEKDIARIARGF